MSATPAPGALTAVDRLVVSLVAGINMRALYGADHPALASQVERILEAVATACREMGKDSVQFLAVGQDLVVESKPLRTGSLYHQQFIRALTRRSVERLTIGRDVDTEECVRFLTPMALGGAPVSTRHIVVGRVELLAPGGLALGRGGGGAGGGGGGTLTPRAINSIVAPSGSRTATGKAPWPHGLTMRLKLK